MKNSPKRFLEIMRNKTDREIHTVSAVLGAALFVGFTPMNAYFIVWLVFCCMFSILLMKKLKIMRGDNN
jgi:hypothetical protein